jgi:hypothetical protein
MGSMTGWRGEELEKIGSSDELQIASIGPDGALRKPTTIWVVRLDDGLFVRSVNGRAAAWFRGTQVHHEGRSSAGGVTRDATFVDAKGDLDDRIDDASRTTYRRSAPGIAGSVLTPQARSVTTRLIPRPTTW